MQLTRSGHSRWRPSQLILVLDGRHGARAARSGRPLVVASALVLATACFRMTPHAQTRTLPSGRTLEVARADLVPGPPSVWYFDYVTELDSQDDGPVRRDLMTVWLEVRPEAERLKADEVWLKAWDRRWRPGRHGPVLMQG